MTSQNRRDVNATDALPHVGIPVADEGHARDESLGFGRQVLDALRALGYMDLKHRFSGGKTRVYYAHDRKGREVAIRVNALYVNDCERNRATFGNLLRFRLLQWILPDHPHVVRFLDSGVLTLPDGGDGQPERVLYCVMSWVEGQTIMEAWHDPAFAAGGLKRIRQTVSGILNGMALLYRRGLRHGDLKPRNVMLEKDTWNPVIVDFRFSLHIGRSWQSERKDFRRTLRALLTGELNLNWDEAEPVTDKVRRFWFPDGASAAHYEALDAWVQLMNDLAPGKPLGDARPAEISLETDRRMVAWDALAGH